jgi:N-acyl-D-aspartate/D-glutamate deacylase
MHDLLIRGATVIDGSGGAPRSLDVAVRDGRISAVESRRTETSTMSVIERPARAVAV